MIPFVSESANHQSLKASCNHCKTELPIPTHIASKIIARPVHIVNNPGDCFITKMSLTGLVRVVNPHQQRLLAEDDSSQIKRYNSPKY